MGDTIDNVKVVHQLHVSGKSIENSSSLWTNNVKSEWPSSISSVSNVIREFSSRVLWQWGNNICWNFKSWSVILMVGVFPSNSKHTLSSSFHDSKSEIDVWVLGKTVGKGHGLEITSQNWSGLRSVVSG